ncbi:RagB/SusD family nutrient uptake outer membrane protein [uncultured Croceitalea sp.]|uniref:RagB/SusD family nutrient uptake outer membrane protein n=1 Tax=uncultured Croceitalea sp. TaxID=1798908 RepID=UPI00374EB515
MKKLKYILYTVCLLVINSCSIDNVEPQEQLLEDTVITDESSAINVLNRIYNSTIRSGFYGETNGAFDLGISGLISVSGTTMRPEGTPFGMIPYFENNVPVDDNSISTLYRDMYFAINLSNFFIELVERGDANVSDTRKNELLAEARCMRGLAYFNLLRVFGQFYDLNSSFGTVVYTDPLRGNTEFPRSSVQETYNLILDDLQFASANANGGREHYYASAITAQALLARVQLYMGDYTNAATNALAVINNTDGYMLDPSYANVFNERWGAETLLASFVNTETEGTQGGLFAFDTQAPTTTFIDLADAQDGVLTDGSADFTTGYDPRFTFGFVQTTHPLFGKYPLGVGFTDPGNTAKILRMGEVYLIYAEAEARRSGGVLANALTRLNEVRARAGVMPKLLTDQATLLKDIREEKILELYAEVGENWFDLVRYSQLGDIDVSTLKPSITSVDQLIFPIPADALTGNSLLIPNP